MKADRFDGVGSQRFTDQHRTQGSQMLGIVGGEFDAHFAGESVGSDDHADG